MAMMIAGAICAVRLAEVSMYALGSQRPGKNGQLGFRRTSALLAATAVASPSSCQRFLQPLEFYAAGSLEASALAGAGGKKAELAEPVNLKDATALVWTARACDLFSFKGVTSAL